MDNLKADVAIVGAGVTGLTAATRLRAAGLEVVVLEARGRVGGRLWTDHIDGQLFEIGGQWVSPDQSALLETLAELELGTYERYRDGDSLYLGADGVTRRFRGGTFPTSPSTASEIERLVGILDALVAEIKPAAPWSHPRAAEFDHLSFEGWLSRESADAEARVNIALFIAGAMLTKPAHTFSLLQALLMAASAGSFSHLVDADFILDRRVVGGLQQVPLALAARLGDRVLLGRAVSTIERSDTAVRVHASATDSSDPADVVVVDARFAIVAVPPNLYGRIRYDPPLPRLRQQAAQHQSLGLVIKVHATYASPFWRADGLSGTAFGPYSIVHESYDNSNFGEDRGTLVGFVSDEKADTMFALTPEERRSVILASLAEYYGPQALEPLVYFESDWAAEEWTQGAYAASFDLGGLTRYGALQLEPVGRLRFGSSDLAAEGYQHVDGAIRVGRRLSAEILAESTASDDHRVTTTEKEAP